MIYLVGVSSRKNAHRATH